ncbi:MAG: TIGR02996 domain-containing protein, partial [Planctomycetales bacterium]
MDEKDFFAEIAAAPDDEAPKLLFADWLEERGDPRADFIRAAVRGAEHLDLRRAMGVKLSIHPEQLIRDAGLPSNLRCAFAADCAERVLPLFEENFPDDDRLRQAIEAARSESPNANSVSWRAYSAARLAQSVADALQPQLATLFEQAFPDGMIGATSQEGRREVSDAYWDLDRLVKKLISRAFAARSAAAAARSVYCSDDFLQSAKFAD